MNNQDSTVVGKVPFGTIDWVKMALVVVLTALVYYAYWVQPVDHTMTCYVWLVGHWASVSNYSHGPLIPVIAALLVWWKRKELLAAPIAPTRWGIAVVALAVGSYYVGVKAVQPRVVVFSFVVLLYGLALSLGGREVYRVLFFPITFLLLMIPLNFLDEQVGFPLRQMVASTATALLNFLGIETVRVGTGIYSRVFRFDVADPCSGIRSLMALTTVTAAYGYVTQHVQWKRWVLFLSAMPLAVLGNLARVTSIALVAQVYGQEIASKAYHEYSGYIVFGVALSAMVVIGLLLNFPYRRVFGAWTKPLPPVEHDESLLPPVAPRQSHE
ncbi:MAG TPA: exosortase/archaeosortase family protein [Verrucomicrobiae bacterium]|nr:exosortase/archaeosortase family protein [Verrucomicrobiae bacterium]